MCIMLITFSNVSSRFYCQSEKKSKIYNRVAKSKVLKQRKLGIYYISFQINNLIFCGTFTLETDPYLSAYGLKK